MNLTREDIKYLANLSDLEICEEDIEKYLNDINSIVDFVNQIREIDMPNELKYKIVDLKELREDEVGTTFTQEEALANAPYKKMGCFNVPLMME